MPKATVVTLSNPSQGLMVPNIPPGAQKVAKLRNISWTGYIYKVWDLLISLVSRKYLSLNILAFLLGRVAIMGEMSPFGLAFFAAIAEMSRDRALAVGFWASIGVLSGGHYSEAGVYIFSMLVYWRLAGKITRIHQKLLAVPLLMFATVSLSGLTLALYREATLYNTMSVFFDAAICMVLAYIFMYSAPLLAGFRSVARQASNESWICMAVLLALAVAGIGSLTVYGFNIRNMAGSLLIMALALSGGAGLGAAVGVAIGLVVGLTEGNAPAAIAFYSLAGVLAGVFRSLGKYAVILGYILGSVITVLYFGQVREVTIVLAESAVAAAVFLILPAKNLAVWSGSLVQASADSIQRVNEAVGKLNNIREMFSDLANTFANISDGAQERIREEELSRVLSAVGKSVCEECTRRNGCWDNDFYKTYQGMLEMLEVAERSKLSTGNMPKHFRESCVKRQDLVGTVNLVVERNRTLTYWQKKIVGQRQMVAEQMQATASIIDSLAHEITKEPRSDKEMALLIKEKAALLNCRLDSVRVTGIRGAAMVDICKSSCNGTRECTNTILPMAASLMHEKMMLRAECGGGLRQKNCKVTLQTANRFGVQTGMASSPKESQGVCGDTCAVVRLSKGKVALLLSDGMGSGSAAAGESSMAVHFMEKLLSAGFDVDVAVKTINSMLLLKAPDENFATVDMAIVDTYSGEVEFLKIGAAPSYIKRVREVTSIKSTSLPIGILNHIEIDPIKSQVVPGDIIVMVSDGIMDAPRSGLEKEEWLENFLRRISGNHPQQIADHILQKAVEMAGGHLRDDMTVLVSRIVERPE